VARREVWSASIPSKVQALVQAESLFNDATGLEPLVRRAGITRPDAARHEETLARLRMAEAALARLSEQR
jgi:hypothetical protein